MRTEASVLCEESRTTLARNISIFALANLGLNLSGLICSLQMDWNQSDGNEKNQKSKRILSCKPCTDCLIDRLGDVLHAIHRARIKQTGMVAQFHVLITASCVWMETEKKRQKMFMRLLTQASRIYTTKLQVATLMLHKDLPVIPIIVFSITGFSCVVWEYLISLNAIQKKMLSNKTPYFTSSYFVLSLFTHVQCLSLHNKRTRNLHYGNIN